MTTTADHPSHLLDQALVDGSCSRRLDGEVRFDAGSRARLRHGRLELPPGPDRRRGAPHTSTPASRRSRSAPRTACRCCPAAAAPAWPGSATNAAVVIDWTKYCHRLVSVDAEARTCVVEPGIVLDELNRAAAPTTG